MATTPANDDQPADPKATEDRAYFEFYLMGRDEAADDFEDRDFDEQLTTMAAEVVAITASVRTASYGLAEGIVRTELETRGKSVAWHKSSRRLRRDIDEAGGDISRAYGAYCAGYRDELAALIEGEVISMIADDEDGDADDEPQDDKAVDDDLADGT